MRVDSIEIPVSKDLLEEAAHHARLIEELMSTHNSWPNVYIGLDPGASGGLAWIATDESNRDVKVGSLVSMPGTEVDILTWMYDVMVETDMPVFAMIEQVSGYIGDAQPASSAFNFGMNYGYLRMALTAACIPYETVRPERWQRALGIPPRITRKNSSGKAEESKGAYKSRLKQHAQQLFPGTHITLNTCDALLLAEYCRRVRTGTLR